MSDPRSTHSVSGAFRSSSTVFVRYPRFFSVMQADADSGRQPFKALRYTTLQQGNSHTDHTAMSGCTVTRTWCGVRGSRDKTGWRQFRFRNCNASKLLGVIILVESYLVQSLCAFCNLIISWFDRRLWQPIVFFSTSPDCMSPGFQSAAKYCRGWEITGGIMPGVTLDFNRPGCPEHLKNQTKQIAILFESLIYIYI